MLSVTVEYLGTRVVTASGRGDGQTRAWIRAPREERTDRVTAPCGSYRNRHSGRRDRLCPVQETREETTRSARLTPPHHGWAPRAADHSAPCR
ncbi:hypothetical protein RHA1_ro03396 [Rhodococcus jostii RHA1]|uniref:Uncharacterized protein n=1 Tax=Rhodococcus jostii (strain RHA1) TaxID=101510 RepID=Q0SB87_RHOJR|nr:hypothetical protein RHA1_ro03396 [Rhodococcus jostii RHA1]